MINSSKELGSGVPEGGTAICAEKLSVSVAPSSTSNNTVWKFWSTNGVVKVPINGVLRPVRLSTSNPSIMKEADELELDRFCKLNGDWSGVFGVHSCPAAGGKAEQPAAPSIPILRSVNVKVMFGAAVVIKSATGGKLPGGVVTSGGLLILSIEPVVLANAVKPPSCNGPADQSLPTNASDPRDMLTSPVIFSTPVMKLACAAKGMPTIAKTLSVKILFVIGSFLPWPYLH